LGVVGCTHGMSLSPLFIIPLSPLQLPCRSNDVFSLLDLPPVGAALCPMSNVLKEDFLGRSVVGHSATLRCGRPPSITSAPHCLHSMPLTPLIKRPLSFQSTLSPRSRSLTPSDRSRPHRMRRSNSILRPTPTFRIRLYTPRFTPHAIPRSLD
jgi:hypothetical protein